MVFTREGFPNATDFVSRGLCYKRDPNSQLGNDSSIMKWASFSSKGKAHQDPLKKKKMKLLRQQKLRLKSK